LSKSEFLLDPGLLKSTKRIY